MSRYKVYPEYKDSGLQWMGVIPKHWDVVYSKAVFQERNEKASIEDEQLTASQKYGILPQKLFMEIEQQRVVQVLKGQEILKRVEKNDFVISMRSFQGGIEFSPYSGSISSAYVPLFARAEVSNGFFKYFLKSEPYIQALQSTTNLVRDGQALRYANFVQVTLPRFPVTEQEKIANFLDHETAKIDTLIAKQQELIKLLKEKRQAVISHAVTKGLNPNAPMRDSGVEWLGEVPAHWHVVPIKHIVEIPVTDGPHETPQFIDEGIPFISAEAVSSGTIDFQKIRAHISSEDHARFSKKYSPKKFDIYMVKSGATTGVTAIVETDIEFNIWSPLAVIRCKATSDPYFVLNFLRSINFKEAVELNWSFGTQQNIGMGVIENLHVTRPPVDEAMEIVRWLNRHISLFDKAIDCALRQIQLSSERRTALISAAVTGKIDVRDWQPPSDAAIAA